MQNPEWGKETQGPDFWPLFFYQLTVLLLKCSALFDAEKGIAFYGLNVTVTSQETG